MIIVHPTHSPVRLHTQMILDKKFQPPQTHQRWCFHPPLSVPLVHSNLGMQIDTQT